MLQMKGIEEIIGESLNITPMSKARYSSMH